MLVYKVKHKDINGKGGCQSCAVCDGFSLQTGVATLLVSGRYPPCEECVPTYPIFVVKFT